MEWTVEYPAPSTVRINVGDDVYQWPSPDGGKGAVAAWCGGDRAMSADIPVAALEHLLRIVKAQP